MNVSYWIAALGLVAVTYGIPMPQAATGGQGLVPGVFIPADAFKNLQARANANNGANNNQGYQPNQPTTVYQANAQPTNTVYQPSNNAQPVYQPANTNQPQYANVAYQQPAMTVQPNSQPVATNQAQPLIADRQPNTIQPTVVLSNQPNTQPRQSIIYVQQPTRPTILVPQPQQSGLNGQPNNVIFANPSQSSNGGTVYTLIPLNTQNSNTNSGSYFIPVQSGNSNPIVLSTGK